MNISKRMKFSLNRYNIAVFKCIVFFNKLASQKARFASRLNLDSH